LLNIQTDEDDDGNAASKEAKKKPDFNKEKLLDFMDKLKS
jgi:hypothetical protein